MALITNEDSSVLPYNDREMVYDLDRQMYLLTDEGVRKLTGIDLQEQAGNANEAELVRYETSQDIYNFIARYSLNSAYKYKVWLIAKDADLRSLFKRVLADQIRYYVRSGAGMLKDMHGVNIANGKTMDLSSLRGNVLVSASVETQLNTSGLLYCGRMYYSEYSEDGTW